MSLLFLSLMLTYSCGFSELKFWKALVPLCVLHTHSEQTLQVKRNIWQAWQMQKNPPAPGSFTTKQKHFKQRSLPCVHVMWRASRAVACPVSPSCRSAGARDTQCVCVVAFHACSSSSCHPPDSHGKQAQAKWTHLGQADPKLVSHTTSQFGLVYLEVNCAGLHKSGPEPA